MLEGRKGMKTFQEEKKMGCWSLMSKEGMRTDVRVLDRSVSSSKHIDSKSSRPLALYLGPARDTKFFRNRPKGRLPISSNRSYSANKERLLHLAQLH
jgi:hypothetical protein